MWSVGALGVSGVVCVEYRNGMRRGSLANFLKRADDLFKRRFQNEGILWGMGNRSRPRLMIIFFCGGGGPRVPLRRVKSAVTDTCSMRRTAREEKKEGSRVVEDFWGGVAATGHEPPPKKGGQVVADRTRPGHSQHSHRRKGISGGGGTASDGRPK